ncbi:MAG: bifunctional hydroxymethylpyrimidine kinase/phosphomethylpyrimidine kinase [Myxococcota bacterium]
MSLPKRPATALTIAGSDSGGGAGIQADLKTFAALKVHGLSAIAALTAQSTTEVRDVLAVPANFVAAQLDTLVDDFPIDACKTGMIADPATIEVVAQRVEDHAWPLVVDPVMVAATGARLVNDEVVDGLRSLFRLATVVTPNLDEMEVLTGVRPRRPEEMADAALALCREVGAGAVLLKGGHLEGEPVDVLVTASGDRMERGGPRIPGRVGHGTGCTYASAIAAWLSRGVDLQTAFDRAHAFVRGALAHAPKGLGRGSQPLHPLHAYFDGLESAPGPAGFDPDS